MGFLGKSVRPWRSNLVYTLFSGQFDIGALKPDPGVIHLNCGLLGRQTEGSDTSSIRIPSIMFCSWQFSIFSLIWPFLNATLPQMKLKEEYALDQCNFLNFDGMAHLIPLLSTCNELLHLPKLCEFHYYAIASQ